MEKEISNFNEKVQTQAEILLRTENIYTIATRLAEYMVMEKERTQPVKIVVTEDEYQAINKAISRLFRVKGYNEDGTVSKRGRPKK